FALRTDPEQPLRSVWQPEERGPEDDSNFVPDMEPGASAHYDFAFHNVGKSPVVVGLQKKSCACLGVQLGTFSDSDWDAYQKALPSRQGNGELPPGGEWRDLAEDDSKGVEIPAGARGAFRVNWNVRSQADPMLVLSPQVWLQPPGNPQARQLETMYVG